MLNHRCLMAFLVALNTSPLLANNANFGQLNLALGFNQSSAVVTGHTGGSYSLSSITNKDRYGRPCIGFGAPNPDHTLVLASDFPRLKLKVNSGGKDTTLVIRGPDGVRCGDDTGDNKDASVDDENWKEGTYEIWVGSMNAGQHLNYRLSAQQ